MNYSMNLSLNVALHGRIEGEATFCATSRFIGITGPSGAGKSSFLRCIAGFEKEAKVRASWPSQIASKEAQLKIGIVFQQPLLFPHVNVQGNLGLARRHASKNAISIEEALTGCCCSHLVHKSIDSLSGGEAQRVAIARALVNGPDILLLDESLSAIDSQTRRKIYRFLHKLCASSLLTCLVVSHDIDDLLLFSDELVYIHNGNIAAVGEVNNVIQAMFQYGGMESMETPSAVIDAVVEHLIEPEAGKIAEPDSSLNIANKVYSVMALGQRLYVSEKSLTPVSAYSHTSSESKDAENKPLTNGQPVRISIKASDVSIDTNVSETSEQTTSSILNALTCHIEDITFFDSHQQGRVLLTLGIQDTSAQGSDNDKNGSQIHQEPLYAVISALSFHRLALERNMPVVARFKLL